jgi:hypothetical protein
MKGKKAKRRLCGTALRKLQLSGTYHSIAFAARLLERPYWFFEQRRGRIADRIDNERSGR